MRFNPPPGWPPAPEGWVPPLGWTPDPSWPPAPAGWTFLVPETPAQPGPLPYAPGFDAPGFDAQGFNGHGVALATLAGRAIADAIAGHSEDWRLLADLPYRPWPGGMAVSRLLLPFVRGFRHRRHGLASRSG